MRVDPKSVKGKGCEVDGCGADHLSNAKDEINVPLALSTFRDKKTTTCEYLGINSSQLAVASLNMV